MRTTTSTSRRRRMEAWRARRDQRGASVLIVFLVLTMLAGIGMYAARSATLSTATAGSVKKLDQTRYIAEYALVGAVSRDPQAYVQQMPKYTPVPNDPKCYGFSVVPNATCFALSSDGLDSDAGMPLVLPPDVPSNVPGALGPSALETDFNIDLTDLMPASPPIPGEALNADSPVKVSYFSVTLTATGQLRPTVNPADAAGVAKGLASTATVQAWRAHVVIGPIPNPAPRQYVP
ncbi:MAG: hypothetical protein R3B70_45265 [Polyangiaceae bacterium]